MPFSAHQTTIALILKVKATSAEQYARWRDRNYYHSYFFNQLPVQCMYCIDPLTSHLHYCCMHYMSALPSLTQLCPRPRRLLQEVYTKHAMHRHLLKTKNGYSSDLANGLFCSAKVAFISTSRAFVV